MYAFNIPHNKTNIMMVLCIKLNNLLSYSFLCSKMFKSVVQVLDLHNVVQIPISRYS
jgi:hypothetical protein